MVSRRKFLGMLAALPAITALAGSTLRLPRREDFDVNAYLTGRDAWYLKTGFPGSLYNRATAELELTEKSLDDILKHMNEGAYRVQPTKIHVPPRLAHTAQYVLTHKPTLFERFMWRLFPVD